MGLKDVIVEGFIAEHIGSNADSTLIPDWLWQEMEVQGVNKARTRSPRDAGGRHYFHYENFFQADWPHINRWGQGQSVPDITQTETKLYFATCSGNTSTRALNPSGSVGSCSRATPMPTTTP